MKKIRLFTLFLVCLLCLISPAYAYEEIKVQPAQTPEFGFCVLSVWTLTVDGVHFECQMYNIDGNNYFKLRDLALALRNTACEFSVNWDAEKQIITAVSGEKYVPVGSEGLMDIDKSASCEPSTHAALFNGNVSMAFCYNIGGNNYFKLRDLAPVFGYEVDYDSDAFLAIISTKAGEPASVIGKHGNWSNPESINYVVTFQDWDGTVLKSERIPADGNAFPPENPTRLGYVFTGWEGSYNNVSSDVIVTAKYRVDDMQFFNVTFYDYDDTTILEERTNIPIGGYAEPPAPPIKDAATFLGWTGRFADVVSDAAVKAVYDDEANVFTLSPSIGQDGETITVAVRLCGKVKTCGFDISLMYDEDLELMSYNDALDLDIITNWNAFDNGIRFNYSGVKNLTKQRDLIVLTFRIKSTTKAALPIWMSVTSIYEIVGSDLFMADYQALDSAVLVK